MTVGTIGQVVKGVGMSIFSDPKKLQDWAIDLANACGGFKIKKSLEVQPPNVERVNKLLALIGTMQSNMDKMYARIKKLEERNNV